jgi:hypothetical protein
MDPSAFARPDAASRRRALGVLGGALALLGEAASGRAKGRHPAAGRQKVVLCHNGHEIAVPASAMEAHLAHGDTLGPCTPPPPPQDAGGCAQQNLFGVCTPFQTGFTAPCCGQMTCTLTAGLLVASCEQYCSTDDDCKRAFPHKALACRIDALVCPVEAINGHKCCVPR